MCLALEDFSFHIGFGLCLSQLRQFRTFEYFVALTVTMFIPGLVSFECFTQVYFLVIHRGTDGS